MGEDPLSESAKATQEVAKATGKGIDAAREFGSFFAGFVKEPLEEASGILSDHLR